MKTDDRLGRREALVGIGVGAAAAGAVASVPLLRGVGEGDFVADPAQAAAAAREAATHPGLGLTPAPAGDPVRALFGPLTEGSAVSTHWRLERLYQVRGGAIPVVLSTAEGQRFGVEIFRADDGGARPVATAGALALILLDDGNGSTPTNELEGLGVMALARELEGRLAAGAPVPRDLVTHRQRLARSPGGDFDIPV